MQPNLLTRPKVGFKPTVPQKAAGIRIEPPVSVPIAIGIIPAATAAPEPPLDPPGTHSRLWGLWTAPKWGLLDVTPYANSWRFVFPTIIAPAPSSLSTTAASKEETKYSNSFEPPVVRMPFI